jgi:hypothetical protein
MTIDATFSWLSDEGKYTRDTNKPMEMGWLISTTDKEY